MLEHSSYLELDCLQHNFLTTVLKIALGCVSCNFIAVLATAREIYPKFHSYLCYYIYKYFAGSAKTSKFMNVFILEVSSYMVYVYVYEQFSNLVNEGSDRLEVVKINSTSAGRISGELCPNYTVLPF